MHGNGSSKAERKRYNVIWSKYEYGCSDYNGLVPEYRDGVRGTDRADPLSGRIVYDRGGSQALMFLHAEEDVDSRLNQEG